VKFLKVPPLRAILTLIVNLEEHLRKDGEPGCLGVGGREGREEGEKGEGEERQGETQRGGEVGERSNEAELETPEASQGCFTSFKTIFENVQTMCLWVFKQKPEQPRGCGDRGRGRGESEFHCAPGGGLSFSAWSVASEPA
jgi:hypothetical protein